MNLKIENDLLDKEQYLTINQVKSTNRTFTTTLCKGRPISSKNVTAGNKPHAGERPQYTSASNQ